jgi:phosphate starvation-inducible protein PhoH
LMGDPNQSDLRGTSDLNRFCAMLAKHSIDASVVRFTVDDIVRSDIVGQLARAFEKEGL